MAATWVSNTGWGDDLRQMPDDLDVLPAGMEHLLHLLIAHQGEERREVQPFRKGIDDDGLVDAGHLNHAELRPEGRLTQELGVDSDEVVAGEALAGGCQGLVWR